jgi:hypothetical protein
MITGMVEILMMEWFYALNFSPFPLPVTNYSGKSAVAPNMKSQK